MARKPTSKLGRAVVRGLRPLICGKPFEIRHPLSAHMPLRVSSGRLELVRPLRPAADPSNVDNLSYSHIRQMLSCGPPLLHLTDATLIDANESTPISHDAFEWFFETLNQIYQWELDAFKVISGADDPVSAAVAEHNFDAVQALTQVWVLCAEHSSLLVINDQLDLFRRWCKLHQTALLLFLTTRHRTPLSESHGGRFFSATKLLRDYQSAYQSSNHFIDRDYASITTAEFTIRWPTLQADAEQIRNKWSTPGIEQFDRECQSGMCNYFSRLTKDAWENMRQYVDSQPGRIPPPPEPRHARDEREARNMLDRVLNWVSSVEHISPSQPTSCDSKRPSKLSQSNGRVAIHPVARRRESAKKTKKTKSVSRVPSDILELEKRLRENAGSGLSKNQIARDMTGEPKKKFPRAYKLLSRHGWYRRLKRLPRETQDP